MGNYESPRAGRGNPDAGEFLSGPEAARALARAATVSRAAASIHAYDAGQESERVAGCGACARACAFVHTLAWGPQACRRSREKHARSALKRGRPVPFLCHMGFACVAAPVLGRSDGEYAITIGPYCPAETPEALERDAMDGLARLEQLEREELPFSLDDIPRIPAAVVPEVAEWLNETLVKQFLAMAYSPDHSVKPDRADKIGDETLQEREESLPRTGLTGSDRSPGTRRRAARVDRDAFGALAILSAMANPDPAAFREAVSNHVAAGSARRTPEQLRARITAVVAAVTEAAQGAGRPLGTVSTTPALRRLAAVLGDVREAEDGVGAAVRALAPLRRQLLRAPRGWAAFYAGVERYVEERLPESLRLAAAAEHFGLTPSTLTRRLERRYGQTFCGYVALRRVEQAKTLLARSTLSVETVARRVGLTDAAHLRKLLRRFEGTTPTQARRLRNRMGTRGKKITKGPR